MARKKEDLTRKEQGVQKTGAKTEPAAEKTVIAEAKAEKRDGKESRRSSEERDGKESRRSGDERDSEEGSRRGEAG